MRVFTIGHGRRPAEELVALLREAGAETLVDVRRFPGSRRNPQFNQARLAQTLGEVGMGYLHAVELLAARGHEGRPPAPTRRDGAPSPLVDVPQHVVNG